MKKDGNGYTSLIRSHIHHASKDSADGFCKLMTLALHSDGGKRVRFENSLYKIDSGSW